MNINWFIFPSLTLALLLFSAGIISFRRVTSIRSRILLFISGSAISIPGIIMVVYYFHFFDNATWYYRFRSIPGAELTACGAGFLAGLLAESFRNRPQLITRTFFVIMLCLGIAVPYIKPIAAPLTHGFSDRWRDDVCLQSTPSSCGPASAATVFKACSVDIREIDIARECHTYRGGTENWYIARAFRKRGFDVNYRIENGFPDDLQTPAIAGVKYLNFGHFIAIIDKTNDVYVTGDPISGRKDVPIQDITKDFRFTGFFMEIRKRTP